MELLRPVVQARGQVSLQLQPNDFPAQQGEI